MASISKDRRGNRVVQFVLARKRHTVRLGKVTQRVAEEVKIRIERLIAAKVSNVSLDQETAQWVAGLGDELADRLTATGLIAARQTATIGEFTRNYLEGRRDAKQSTIVSLNQARDRLVEFFGANKPLRNVSQADADRWVIWMTEHYSLATVGRKTKQVRQLFKAAIRARLLAEDPFSHIKAHGQTNARRKAFVSRETIQHVLDACPDAEWRLIVALCRYGGLRCPSEVLGLRVEDVNWDRGRFLVRATKTEHHEGMGERWVPIFPELKPYIEDAFDELPEGQTHFVVRDKGGGVNLRQQLLRIIHRAGELPWPRLFQNLRASRETELAAQFPLHVVCSWIGNSAAVAAAHYLQVTDGDFARAAQSGAVGALQNPEQQTDVHSVQMPHETE